MVTRREFLKLSGAGILSLYAASHGKFLPRAFAQIPGGTLDPLGVPKYVTPLLIPPVMPRAAVLKQMGREIDYYEISMRQFQEQILPAGMPATTVWGYGALKSATPKGLLLHNAPSLTIEAKANRPVRVKWINELIDANGNYLPHLLPVDPTLHWANPAQGSDPLYGNGPRDSRPAFTGTPGRYTGPVPIVSHLHGAVGVGDESDGYAEAWYLPAANNIPAGYATEGTWYGYFRAKAKAAYSAKWGPGFATFQYPNHNRASTIWYHDHALGMTRLNVYAGPAGFYIVRGGPSGDKAVLDSRTGTEAILPGPAPAEGDGFPGKKTYYEIPIAIQDRSFNSDGSLFYPDTRAFFDNGLTVPYIPNSNVSPIWNPEFFGNMIMVNGTTWPFQMVEQRRYRIRFLNGCQSRFLILDFSHIPGVDVWQIGNEGGFLAAPVNLTVDHGNQLLMGLAERADLIVDFTNVQVGDYILGNVGPDEPFGGLPIDSGALADPQSTGQIMQFRVMPSIGPDPTTPPQFLVLPAIAPLPLETKTRTLALLEMAEVIPDLGFEGPSEAMLGNLEPDGMPMHKMWSASISENPNVGDTEVWEFYNFTADAHPMHVHEVTFEVVNRQALVANEDGETLSPAQLVGGPRAPEAWENGLKDTVIAYPGEVTRIKATFDTPGQFVWHCHIVEHEDNEMMRPYRIGPAQPGQPDQPA
jgi:FtsP/CotA-like multicopper oxidase with cupredoxin domain